MVAELQRSDRTDGCSASCVDALVVLARGSYLTLHDPTSHEDYGRRQASGSLDIVETGPLVVDFRRLACTVDGESIYLTRIETNMLLALARRRGGTITPVDWVREAWGEDRHYHDIRSEASHLIRVNVSRLRARLRAASGLIETQQAIGYRLIMIEPGRPAPLPSNAPHGFSRNCRWARDHDACVDCGQTSTPHQSHGRCIKCHYRHGVITGESR